MKKNKTFIFIIPFIFISFLCFINNVEAKKESVSQTVISNTSNTAEVSTSSDDVKLYRTVRCGNTELPENLVKLISIAITAIQVVTPLILIVTGMVDFLKATTSSNEDGIKKSSTNFRKKIDSRGSSIFYNSNC